jgi:hypothetical protein
MLPHPKFLQLQESKFSHFDYFYCLENFSLLMLYKHLLRFRVKKISPEYFITPPPPEIQTVLEFLLLLALEPLLENLPVQELIFSFILSRISQILTISTICRWKNFYHFQIFYTIPFFQFQATNENIREFQEAVQKITTEEIANFTSALTVAFELLRDSFNDPEVGANCNQVSLI